MPKFKVDWTNTVTFSCVHEIEAYDMDDAIKKCGRLDSGDIERREEVENVDTHWNAEEIE